MSSIQDLSEQELESRGLKFMTPEMHDKHNTDKEILGVLTKLKVHHTDITQITNEHELLALLTLALTKKERIILSARCSYQSLPFHRKIFEMMEVENKIKNGNYVWYFPPLERAMITDTGHITEKILTEFLT